MRSQVAGLASVGDLRVKKVLRTAVDLVGYRNDQRDPFSRCHLAPWPTKRRSCRRHCVGDVGFASLMNRAGRLPGCRVDVGKGLSLAALAIGTPNEVEDGVGNGSWRIAGHLIIIDPMCWSPEFLMLCSSDCGTGGVGTGRSVEHTSELQSLMRISYAYLFFKK